jgi:hypothetical protein
MRPNGELLGSCLTREENDVGTLARWRSGVLTAGGSCFGGARSAIWRRISNRHRNPLTYAYRDAILRRAEQRIWRKRAGR